MSRRSRIQQVTVSRFLERSHIKEYDADRQPFLLTSTEQFHKTHIETTYVKTVGINLKLKVEDRKSSATKHKDVSRTYSKNKRQPLKVNNRERSPVRKKSVEERKPAMSRKIQIKELSQTKKKQLNSRKLAVPRGEVPRTKKPTSQSRNKRSEEKESLVLQFGKDESGKSLLRRKQYETDKTRLRRTQSYEHLFDKSNRHGYDQFKGMYIEKRPGDISEKQIEMTPFNDAGKLSFKLARSASDDDIKLLRTGDQDKILAHLRRDIKFKQLADIYGSSDRYKIPAIKSSNKKQSGKDVHKKVAMEEKIRGTGKFSFDNESKKIPKASNKNHGTSSTKNSENKSDQTYKQHVTISDKDSIKKLKATNRKLHGSSSDKSLKDKKFGTVSNKDSNDKPKITNTRHGTLSDKV